MTPHLTGAVSVGSHISGHTCSVGLQYLNTVIPYEKKASPPSVEDLQMLTNSESLSSPTNSPFRPILTLPVPEAHGFLGTVLRGP